MHTYPVCVLVFLLQTLSLATTVITLNIGLLYFYPSALGTLEYQPGACSASEFKSNNALFWLVLLSMFAVNLAMMAVLGFYFAKVTEPPPIPPFLAAYPPIRPPKPGNEAPSRSRG